jgi:hypothetical protein
VVSREKGFLVSEENESNLRKLLFGGDHSESEEKVLSYVTHRLKEGAHLTDVLREEYVVRNITPAERDKIRQDPELVREAREGLEQDFESDKLKPDKHPRSTDPNA